MKRRAIAPVPAVAQPTVDQVFNLGLKHQRAGDFPAATRLFDQVLARQPKHWGAIQLLGVIAYREARYEAALDLLLKSINIEPNQASTHGNLGLVLDALNRFDESIAATQRAISLRPQDPNLHFNLGHTFYRAGKAEDAVLAYRQALALRPGGGEVLDTIGGSLNNLRLRTAFKDQPGVLSNLGGALNNLGSAFKDQGDLDRCIATYREATLVQPNDPAIHSNLLLTLHYHPESDPVALMEEHRQWSERHVGPITKARTTDAHSAAPRHLNVVDPNRRLRIGYVSADFRQHAVSKFLLPLITNHDSDRVELYAYSQVNSPDALTEQYRARVAVWRDITRLSDAAAAQLVRSDQIDILVDLAGHSAGNRLLVFANKPAPLQVSYLGYPASTGLREIDYRLTDSLADPPGQTERFYTEKLLRIQPCAWCFRPAADIPLCQRSSGSITFGSFNTLAKVSQPTLGVWSEILNAVPGSRLLLKSNSLKHPASQQSVLKQLNQLGIGAERVTLRGSEPAYADHLSLYGQVDIALDTFPYNGTTTTCEALWMGSPVVTLAGTTHVSRVGVSLLSAVGLPELIADSAEQYIERAVGLAKDGDRLRALHETLRHRMEQSPLMDAKTYARKVEAAYRQIWQGWCAQQSAVSLDAPPAEAHPSQTGGI